MYIRGRTCQDTGVDEPPIAIIGTLSTAANTMFTIRAFSLITLEHLTDTEADTVLDSHSQGLERPETGVHCRVLEK